MSEKLETNGAANLPLLHNIHAAADRLSMSTVSVRKLIRQNRLHRIENFRKILIPESELQRFATAK